MASKHEPAGAQPRRKLVTYGKTVKKTNTFSRARSLQPSSGPERAAPTAAPTRPQQQQQERDPFAFDDSHDESSPEPLSLGHARLPSLGKDGAQRKRKIAHVYSADEQGQDPLSEGSSPSVPKGKPRSRVTSPSEPPVASIGKVLATRQPPPPPPPPPAADTMEVDATDHLLSSPPPAPIVSKERRPNGKGIAKKETPFSPNTVQLFNNLHVGAKNSREQPRKQPREQPREQRREQQIPVRLAKSTSKPPTNITESSGKVLEKTSRSKRPPTSAPQPAKRPRRKLIDTLKAQRDESDDDPEKSESQVSWSEPVASSSQTSENSAIPHSPSETPRSRRVPGGNTVRTYARSGSSLKYTYGQSKVSMLEEEDLLDALSVPMDTGFSSLKGRRLELGPKVLPKSDMDLENDPDTCASPKGKIRDIHELRQAGENSRVADEMFDLSSQIGKPSAKPSSARRSALLQVADKVRQKDYLRRVRDHEIDALILKDVGDETDIVSGYLISTILLHILATAAAPHIIQLLRDGNVGQLFGRLLAIEDKIKTVARDRKSNLSKRSQGMLLSVEAASLELSIWSPIKLTSTSPRTVALKCLDLLINGDANLGGDETLFPATVTNSLFEILGDAREPEFWDDITASEAFDVHCSLSVLEFHIVKLMEVEDTTEELVTKYLPTVADAFGAALGNMVARNSSLEALLLKLVLNMTNSSTSAPGIFVKKGLLPILTKSICECFSQALAVASGQDWTEGVLDGLVLRIGTLINFAEKNMAVRKAVHESPGDSGSPLQELIRIFLANHRATAEVRCEMSPCRDIC
jgi:hypothetical protein